jgi:ATP-dependent helicase/nuclease subunit A
VTPDAFVITDYKTNQLSNQTTEELAAYYRPQLMSYALALLDYESDREVHAQLRFTEVGETQSFSWSPTDRDSLSHSLRTIAQDIN